MMRGAIRCPLPTAAGEALNTAVQSWQRVYSSHAAGAASPEALAKAADAVRAAAQPLYLQLLLPISQHKDGTLPVCLALSWDVALGAWCVCVCECVCVCMGGSWRLQACFF